VLTEPIPTEKTDQDEADSGQTAASDAASQALTQTNPQSAGSWASPSFLRRLRACPERSEGTLRNSGNPQFNALAWLLVPLLAIAAFAPTLGTWFVSDDFGHLLFHQSLAFPKALFAFDTVNMFYRPLSTVLTWNLGYALFGTNALPYHIFSVLFHALAAYFLARAVAVISNNPAIGWLSGAIFAVYPLCIEPVAWLASQWDVMGAACLTGAVWGFAVAWRNHNKLAYALGLLAAFLAVMMKESTLPLPLIIPFVALATEISNRPSATIDSKFKIQNSKFVRIALWSAPYALPTILFAVLRFIAAGRIGGYPTAQTDIQHFFWDSIVAAAAETVTPLNRLVFPRTFVQATGLLISGLLLLGLAAWGRKWWSLYLLALVWWLGFILPVLNLISPSVNPTNENNRIFYLSMMGFSIALAIPIAAFLQELGHRPKRNPQFVAWVVVGLALLAAVPVTWTQLQPWVVASDQTHHLVGELSDLIAPQSRAWIDINALSLPDDYKGAYAFRNGLDTAMIGFDNQLTRVNRVSKLDPESLANPLVAIGGRYNLGLTFNTNTRLYYVGSLAGVTDATDPPQNSDRLWDFRQCNSTLPTGWEAVHATTQCTGTYLAFRANTVDPNLLLPKLDIDLTGKSWLRLGVSARYPTVSDSKLGEWFWQADRSTSWTEDKSRIYYLDTTKSWRVYWTYIRVQDLGTNLAALRFDPVNDQLNTQLEWISIDLK
jgi:hypothetical protein